MTQSNRLKQVNSQVPTFALYGESASAGQELLHIEDVQSRSRLYHWEIEPHAHRGLFQILWLQSGTAEVVLDEVREALSGPAAIVVPPGVVHGFRFAPDSDGIVLTMNAQFLAEGDLHAVGTSFHSLFSEPRLLRFSANETRADRIYLLLHELLTEFCEPGTADSPVSVWVARSVLWKLAQTISLQDQQIQGARAIRQHTLFPRFLLLVEQHFLEHWPLQNYASRLGLSIPRLNRLVRAEKSCNALEVIHERLTREACRRLIYIAVPTSSLAVELGFEDPAYFSRFFKRRTGHSPQQYRQVYAGNVGDTQSPLGIRREAARRPPE